VRPRRAQSCRIALPIRARAPGQRAGARCILAATASRCRVPATSGQRGRRLTPVPCPVARWRLRRAAGRQIAVIPRASAHAREEGSGRAPPGGQGAGRRSFGHNSQWPAGATSPGGATERVTMKRLLWPLAVVIVPAVIDARTPRARRVGHVLGHG